MLGQSISRNSLILGLFAALTTSIIAGTYLGSREQIKANIRAAEEKALLELIPVERHDNAMLDDTMPTADEKLLGLREPKSIYLAKKSGHFIGAILPVTAREGYTDDIDLIVGINRDGSIAGVRALSHRETPGLGDRVDYKKSHWVDSFIGKSLTSPKPDFWKVKKDGGVFDQFTGATITPRAVTKSVFQALQYYDQHRDELIAAAEGRPHKKTGKENDNE